MIDWELGSIDYWVSVDGGKPFPITMYRKNGEWKQDVHTRKKLTESQQIELLGFFKEREQEITSIWKAYIQTRLKWTEQHVHRK